MVGAPAGRVGSDVSAVGANSLVATPQPRPTGRARQSRPPTTRRRRTVHQAVPVADPAGDRRRVAGPARRASTEHRLFRGQHGCRRRPGGSRAPGPEDCGHRVEGRPSGSGRCCSSPGDRTDAAHRRRGRSPGGGGQCPGAPPTGRVRDSLTSCRAQPISSRSRERWRRWPTWRRPGSRDGCASIRNNTCSPGGRHRAAQAPRHRPGVLPSGQMVQYRDKAEPAGRGTRDHTFLRTPSNASCPHRQLKAATIASPRPLLSVASAGITLAAAWRPVLHRDLGIGAMNGHRHGEVLARCLDRVG